MRPKQWIKNLFVFAALIFAKKFFDPSSILLSLVGFFIFSIASGSVYLLNDVMDYQEDRNHPEKKFRPIAAGQLAVPVAVYASLLFGIGSATVALLINQLFGVLIILYLLLNVSYSLILKKIVILDVFSIAISFVLRVIGGAVIIVVPFSVWLLLCTFFFTLFLAVQKRSNEQFFDTRAVLYLYSPALLEQMKNSALTITIVSYTLYTFFSRHSELMVITALPVLYALFYYYAFAEKKDLSEILLKDRHLQISILLWLLLAILILIYEN